MIQNLQSCFAQAEDLFARAAGHETTDRWFEVANRTICIRFANATLVEAMTAAMAHIACDPRPVADFTIKCWDAATTGIVAPPLPFEAVVNGAPDGITQCQREGLYAHSQPSTGRCVLWNAASKTAIAFFPDGNINPSESVTPFLHPIHLWSQTLGFCMVHGAVVGRPEGAALLVGRGGSGKSTAALSCVGTELRYLCDDYSLVEPGDPPMIHSLFHTGKSFTNETHRYPQLESCLDSVPNLATKKSHYYFYPQLREDLLLDARLAVLMFPDPSGLPESTIEPMSSAAMLRAIAPSTMFQLRTSAQNNFQRFASWVRTIPCRRLRSGTELSKIPDTIKGELDFLLEGIS